MSNNIVKPLLCGYIVTGAVIGGCMSVNVMRAGVNKYKLLVKGKSSLAESGLAKGVVALATGIGATAVATVFWPLLVLTDFGNSF